MDRTRLVKMFESVYTACAVLSEETLARYAELEIAGQEPGKEWPEVSAHLDECSDCAGRYADLLALLQAEARDEVPHAFSSRPFDLGFLSTPRLDVWSEARKAFYYLVDRIPIVIKQARANFGPLPPALVPCYVTAAVGALRDSERTADKFESLRIPDESANVLFTLAPGPALADEAGETGVTLIFKVQDLQSGEPLRQVRVNLYDSKEQLLRSTTTTAEGQAVFSDLVGDYVLQCKYVERTWNLPVRLATDTSIST
jgi:hypothetical protein